LRLKVSWDEHLTPSVILLFLRTTYFVIPILSHWYKNS
jgi:hypothetical protein